MPPGITWTHPRGGLFVWVTLPEGLDSKAMMPRAMAAQGGLRAGHRLLRRRQRPARPAALLLLPGAGRGSARASAGSPPCWSEETELRQVFGEPGVAGWRIAGAGSTTRVRSWHEEHTAP